jgi:2-dehydro-3-deoxygluconokinase
MPRLASIGECMIELSEHADGRITRAFGGDTLNTAIYLARLGVATDYITALGDDRWSEEMLKLWQAEGVGTGSVIRLAGRLPGLYMIETDAGGERRFSYWRDRAPARDLFALPQTPFLCRELQRYRQLYLSGISLSLYGAAGRAKLFEALAQARKGGTTIVFDANFRPRGWPDREEARTAYLTLLPMVDIVFASVADLSSLFGSGWQGTVDKHWQHAESVLKLEYPACRISCGGEVIEVAAREVARAVDTTAAGDSFAAAYLSARLEGFAPNVAARAGHALAGVVVQHRGAIIPRAAWPKAELLALGLTRGISGDVSS